MSIEFNYFVLVQNRVRGDGKDLIGPWPRDGPLSYVWWRGSPCIKQIGDGARIQRLDVTCGRAIKRNS
jgi:hypothetical protein